MAFTEAERVQIRRWLGFSALFTQAEPRLESAITAVQAANDGGSRPDNTTELAVRGYLADLAAIENQIRIRRDQVEADKVDESRIDTARGNAILRQEGRLYVGYLADALSTRPRRDVFSPPSLDMSGGYYL